MNRIEKTTENLGKKSLNSGGVFKKALVGYFMAGEFPHAQTLKIMHESTASGLDIIELGFPFSDPTADGGTIQVSARESLKNGTKIADVFALAKEFRQENQHTPLILMGYFNIVFQYGEENFLKKCSECGIDGLIIVDLPIEESLYFEKIAEKYNIFIIQIVSFLTDEERFLKIQARAKGFIYLVSTLGVTGQTLPMIHRIEQYISSMHSKLPIFVGFGISSPEIAKSVAQYSSGVIVGSYFIQSARNDPSLGNLKSDIGKIKVAINL